MKKTIYTVTYLNEVIAIFDDYSDLRNYIFEEFGNDIQEEYEHIVDADECMELCDEIDVHWQKFEIDV